MDTVQALDQKSPLDGKKTQPNLRMTMGRLIALLLTAVVVVAIAVLIGNVIWSSDWTNAVSIVGLGAVVVVILMSPINGLLLWIILEPYARFWYLNINLPSGIPDLSLGRLSVAFLCIVWVAQLATRKRRIRRFGFIEVFIALFGILVLPSVAASANSLSSTLQTLFDKFISPYLVFILAKNLYDEKTGLDKFVAFLAVIEVYLCFTLFWEHLTGQPLFYIAGRTLVYSKSLRKIVGLLGSAAFLATILAMIAPFMLHKFVRSRSPYARVFYGGMFGLAVIGNIFCYNRGAWLAMAVGLLLMLFLNAEYRRILMPLMLIAALAIGIYWADVTSSAIVVERLSNVTSIRFRVSMLEVSQRMILANPLFGVGFGSFADHYIQYGGHWDLMAWDEPTPHNTYVNVLATMGLAGFLPYVLVFLSLFAETGVMMRRHWRQRGADRALLVAAWASVAAYMCSAVAMDIYPNAFTSLVLLCIMGTVIGYVSQLRASARALRQQAGPLGSPSLQTEMA